jgi:hypothetical protein
MDSIRCSGPFVRARIHEVLFPRNGGCLMSENSSSVSRFLVDQLLLDEKNLVGFCVEFRGTHKYYSHQKS